MTRIFYFFYRQLLFLPMDKNTFQNNFNQAAGNQMFNNQPPLNQGMTNQPSNNGNQMFTNQTPTNFNQGMTNQTPNILNQGMINQTPTNFNQCMTNQDPQSNSNQFGAFTMTSQTENKASQQSANVFNTHPEDSARQNHQSTSDMNGVMMSSNIPGSINKTQNIKKVTDVPINLSQRSYSEIILYFEKLTEETKKRFESKAAEIFEYDERIIMARNNYARISAMVSREEKRLKNLEEGVDVLQQIVENFQGSTTGESVINVIKEVEMLSDEFNRKMESLKDGDNENLQLLEENMRLVRLIDRSLSNYDSKG